MFPAQEHISNRALDLSLSCKLIGLGTAAPELHLTQLEILEFVQKNFSVKPSTMKLYERLLSNQSIQTRHFALDKLSQVLEKNLDRINERFLTHAVQLSKKSLERALKQAGISPKELDYLVVSTCTGYLCPGLAPHVIDAAGLKSSIHYADLVGMGCGSALPALEQASNFVRANPGTVAAVVSTEICSAAMFSSDDIDIAISNSIFSDGSAAVVLKSGGDDIGVAVKSFGSLIVPEWRETLRFKTENGFLKNVLGKNVPEQAGQIFSKLSHRILSDNGLNKNDISHWIIHPGGEKVIQEIEKGLGLTFAQTAASRDILRDHGNMSSASVLFVLEREMQTHPPKSGDKGFLCSFGAGFAAHGALLEWI